MYIQYMVFVEYNVQSLDRTTRCIYSTWYLLRIMYRVWTVRQDVYTVHDVLVRIVHSWIGVSSVKSDLVWVTQPYVYLNKYSNI